MKKMNIVLKQNYNIDCIKENLRAVLINVINELKSIKGKGKMFLILRKIDRAVLILLTFINL